MLTASMETQQDVARIKLNGSKNRNRTLFPLAHLDGEKFSSPEH